MRHIGILAGTALLGLTAGSAGATTTAATATAPVVTTPAVTTPAVTAPTITAPTVTTPAIGAPAAAPLQPGAWGNGGWQPGQGAPAPVADASPVSPPPPGGPHHGHDGYRHPLRGGHVGGDLWRDPTYDVSDWQAWGLMQPGPGMHWLRYYDDAVLVDGYGTVVDARYGVNWAGPRPNAPGAYPQPGGYYPGYQGGAYQGGAYPNAPYPGNPYHGGFGSQSGVTTYRSGPNTTVTTQVVGGGPAYSYGAGYAGGGYYGGGYAAGGSIVTITPGTVVTTTTTTEESYYSRSAVKKRVWHRPIRRHIVRKPACGCGPVLGS